MPQLSVRDVVRWTGGSSTVDVDASASGVVADSRWVARGWAFAAIGGGHAFVADAISAGAPFAIVQDRATIPDGALAVVVDDVVVALGRIASGVRERLSLGVIGITGSTGKTLTKDFVSAALSTAMRVHATPRSFNAEIGVPLTVLGCPDDAEVLVVEMGARRRGEIAELCDIVRPRIGTITGIGSTHLELFGTRHMIAETKSELLRSLPADGVAVVPSNDDFLSTLVASTVAKVVTVGPGGHVSYRADRVDASGRTHGIIRIADREFAIVLPVAGRALMRNAAIALAVATACGIDGEAAAAALASALLSGDRMAIDEIGPWTVVNDTYNANPTSVSSALRTVRELADARGAETWAVLGQMTELGDASDAAHRRVGRLAAACGYSGVIVIGDGAAGIADGAGGIAVRVGSDDEALDAMQRIGSGAFVLVKASRAIGLEGLVRRLREQATSGEVSGTSTASPGLG